MILKTVKLPRQLHERIRRRARLSRRTDSAVIREALDRGLGDADGVNMAEALREFIGKHAGPGDLSTNKAYFDDYGRPRHR